VMWKAPLNADERAALERLGPSVVGALLAVGSGLYCADHSPIAREKAEAWIREQDAAQARRDIRRMWIVLFAVMLVSLAGVRALFR
jgi:hypothetical protein